MSPAAAKTARRAAPVDPELAADRAEYKRLRGSCTRHDAGTFNAIAGSIAHELADGEDITPAIYLQAARIICAGFDCA